MLYATIFIKHIVCNLIHAVNTGCIFTYTLDAVLIQTFETLEMKTKLLFLGSTKVKKKKKKRKTPFYFNVNYRREMKFILTIMDYCLHQFDALKSFLVVVYMVDLHLRSFYFLTAIPQIFQRNPKVYFSNCLETNLHNISNFSLTVVRHWNYS